MNTTNPLFRSSSAKVGSRTLKFQYGCGVVQNDAAAPTPDPSSLRGVSRGTESLNTPLETYSCQRVTMVLRWVNASAGIPASLLWGAGVSVEEDGVLEELADGGSKSDKKEGASERS